MNHTGGLTSRRSPVYQSQAPAGTGEFPLALAGRASGTFRVQAWIGGGASAGVARLAPVDGHDAVVMAVLAPHLFHANASGHGPSFLLHQPEAQAPGCPGACASGWLWSLLLAFLLALLGPFFGGLAVPGVAL